MYAGATERDPAVLMLLWWVFELLRQIYSSKPLWRLEKIGEEGFQDIEGAVNRLQMANVNEYWNLSHILHLSQNSVSFSLQCK